MIHDAARPCNLSEMNPTELKITEIVQMVENLGASVQLTDAVNLLHSARCAVEDHCKGDKTRRRAVLMTDAV